MSVVLPSQIDYTDQLPSLPADTQSIFIKTTPINGSTFSAGSQIMLDFVNRGFLVPDSVYLSWKLVPTGAASGTANRVDVSGCFVLGTPIYSPFSTSAIQIGSQQVETIANYNVVMNTLINGTMDIAQKYGNAGNYGLSIDASSAIPSVPTLAELDGRDIPPAQASHGLFCSGPLMNVLTNAERLIPLGMMPQVRLILTCDAIANWFANDAITHALPTGYTISNVELRYRVVDMPQAEGMVRQMGQKIYIKSQSFSSSTQTLSSVPAGFTELVFNSRYASLKGLIAVNGSNSTNKNFDSFDVTGSLGGEYSFSCGGQIFPPAPISTSQNKSGAIMELKNCFGSIYEKTNAQSINAIEYGYLLGMTTSITEPGKFYVGVSTSKMDSHSLLTGISTQNSPITYRISSSATTANVCNVTLLMNYDALFEIDTANRQVALKT